MSAPATAQQTSPRTLAMPRVRQAKPADAAALADLHERCMDRAYDGVNAEFSRMVSAPAASRNRVAEWLSDRFVTVMMLEMGGRPVGFAAARKNPNGAHELESIGVLPSERRQGYGSLLFRNIAHEASALRVSAAAGQDFFSAVCGERAGVTITSHVQVGGSGFLGRRMEIPQYYRVQQPRLLG